MRLVLTVLLVGVFSAPLYAADFAENIFAPHLRKTCYGMGQYLSVQLSGDLKKPTAVARFTNASEYAHTKPFSIRLKKSGIGTSACWKGTVTNTSVKHYRGSEIYLCVSKSGNYWSAGFPSRGLREIGWVQPDYRYDCK